MSDRFGDFPTDRYTLPLIPADTNPLPAVEDPAPSGPRHARPRNWWRIARITALAAALFLCLAATAGVVVSAASSNGVDGSQWASPHASSTVREPVPDTSGHRSRSPGADRVRPRRAPVLPVPTRRRTATPAPTTEKPHKATTSPKPKQTKPPASPHAAPAPTDTAPTPDPSRTCPPKPGGGDE